MHGKCGAGGYGLNVALKWNIFLDRVDYLSHLSNQYCSPLRKGLHE